jgi:hypothetical protein
MMVLWVCTHPLGSPVVPEVYKIAHRSSASAREVCGSQAAANASFQATVPGSAI